MDFPPLLNKFASTHSDIVWDPPGIYEAVNLLTDIRGSRWPVPPGERLFVNGSYRSGSSEAPPVWARRASLRCCSETRTKAV